MIAATTLGIINGTGPDMRNSANCLSCGWAGKVGELATIPFHNPFGSAEGTLEAFSRDVLMTTVKECAEPLGRLLIKWGFIDGQKIDKRVFSQYLVEIAKASTKALIDKRFELEKKG